jgi:hypothetical protein
MRNILAFLRDKCWFASAYNAMDWVAAMRFLFRWNGYIKKTSYLKVRTRQKLSMINGLHDKQKGSGNL